MKDNETKMILKMKRVYEKYKYVNISKMFNQASIGSLLSGPGSGFIPIRAISFSATTGPI